MAETPKQMAHHIADEVKSLEHEAEVGASARTPAIIYSGVMIVVFAISVLMVVVFAAYYRGAAFAKTPCHTIANSPFTLSSRSFLGSKSSPAQEKKKKKKKTLLWRSVAE